MESSTASRLALFVPVWAMMGSFIMSYSSLMIGSSRLPRTLKVPRGVMRRSERAGVTLLAVALLNTAWSVAYLLLGMMGSIALASGIGRMVWLRRALADRPEFKGISKRPDAVTDRKAAWLKRDSRWLAPGIQGLATESAWVVERGQGVMLEDLSGKTCFDWVAGMGVASVGHAHPRWVDAVSTQAARSSVGSFTTRARVEYLERLFDGHSPAGLDCAQLYSGGAEAVESAIRLSREVTGRRAIAHFKGSFHGKTRGALSVMGSEWKKPWGPYEDLAPLELPYADCTQCPLGLSQATCEMACAERVEQLLARRKGDLAAVIVEPVQGTAGNVIPADGFLKRIELAARSQGILFIVDEMITGFGRTGRFWGLEHAGLQPDIVLAGKGMAGGFPVSALLTHRTLTEAAPFWSAPSGSSSSYGANPLACAAASVTLSIIEDENLVRNAWTVGRTFLDQLQELRSRYPEVIQTVRGQGLLLGVDFAQESIQGFQKRLFHEALNEGVLTLAYARRLRIQPPLSMGEEEVRSSMVRFEKALQSTIRWSERHKKGATFSERLSNQRAS